jgi:hypothetical protein
MYPWRLHHDAPQDQWERGEKVALAVLFMLAMVAGLNLLLALSTLLDDAFYRLLIKY